MSESNENFRIAAEELLRERLDRLMRMDADVVVDTSFITNAEYQLFINASLKVNQFCWPPHWKEAQFLVGESHQAALGMTFQSAYTFMGWLNQRVSGGAHFRFPDAHDRLPKIHNCCAWSDHGKWTGWQGIDEMAIEIKLESFVEIVPFALDLIPSHAIGRDFDLVGAITGDLARAREVARNRAREVARNLTIARARDLDLAIDRNLDRNLAIDRALEVACAIARDLDRNRAIARALNNLALARDFDLARDLAYALDLARDLDLDRARDRALDRALDLNLDRARDRALDRARARALDRALDRALALTHDYEQVEHNYIVPGALTKASQVSFDSNLEEEFKLWSNFQLIPSKQVPNIKTASQTDHISRTLLLAQQPALSEPLLIYQIQQRLFTAAEQIEHYLKQTNRPLLLHAWIDYATALMEWCWICRQTNNVEARSRWDKFRRKPPVVRKDVHREIQKLYWFYRIIQLRIEGKLPAWEGILLVREREK